MNYLQVPAGIGEGQSFDFDIAVFTENFKLNILAATYGLQALAQEGLINYAEVSFRPSTLVFTTTKSDLEEFEKQQPAMEPVIKGLLRTYEGIFDYPASIYESLLAKFLGKPVNEIKTLLFKLHQYQIVQYQPQNDQPQISLLKNRMYADSFTINIKDLLLRKANYIARLKAITAFATDTTSCRSVLIGHYFNDNSLTNCGICDNCINNKTREISSVEFKTIAAKLTEALKLNSFPANSIESAFRQYNKEKLWKVIHFLQAENIITTNKQGELSLSNDLIK